MRDIGAAGLRRARRGSGIVDVEATDPWNGSARGAVDRRERHTAVVGAVEAAAREAQLGVHQAEGGAGEEVRSGYRRRHDSMPRRERAAREHPLARRYRPGPILKFARRVHGHVKGSRRRRLGLASGYPRSPGVTGPRRTPWSSRERGRFGPRCGGPVARYSRPTSKNGPGAAGARVPGVCGTASSTGALLIFDEVISGSVGDAAARRSARRRPT